MKNNNIVKTVYELNLAIYDGSVDAIDKHDMSIDLGKAYYETKLITEFDTLEKALGSLRFCENLFAIKNDEFIMKQYLIYIVSYSENDGDGNVVDVIRKSFNFYVANPKQTELYAVFNDYENAKSYVDNAIIPMQIIVQ